MKLENEWMQSVQQIDSLLPWRRYSWKLQQRAYYTTAYDYGFPGGGPWRTVHKGYTLTHNKAWAKVKAAREAYRED